EAESYDRNVSSSSASWQFQSSQAGYSGNGYMIALPNNATTIGDNDFNSPRLDYDIDFPAAGNWYIWIRASSGSGNDNSLHAGLDGIRTAKTTDVGDADIWSTSGSWKWDNKRANGGDQVVVYVPNEGVHTLSIWMREDGLMVDKIILYSLSSDIDGIIRGSSEVGPEETPLPTGYGGLHIVQQPQTITVNQGQTAQFTVVAESQYTISYQWMKNGEVIPNKTEPTLVIENVQASDAGAYTVVVSDGFNPNVTSAAAYLIVPEAPVIAQQPQSQSAIQGTNVNFSVVATGIGLSYQWFKGELPIPDAIGSILTLRNVQPSDAGSYRVQVQNVAGSTMSEPATLTINVPPYIITPLVSKVVDIGEQVIFSVEAGGDPELTYVWKKDNNVIENQNQSFLELASVQKADEGQYTVIITNLYGTTSSTAQLVVNTRPTVGDVAAQTFEDVPVAIQLSASDTDNNPISVNIVDGPTNGTVNYLTSYTWSSDFNSTEIQGAKLYGVATILPTGGVNNSGVLRLVPNQNGQGGSIVFNEFVPGTIIKGFTATFKVHLGEGSGNPADGFSFNFANDLVDSEWAPDANENGCGSGLRVCFQIYGGDRIVIKKGQTQLAYINTPVYGFYGYVDCYITLNTDGTLMMFFNGQPIVENLQTGVVPGPGYRFGIYARTGGENANMMIDDLTIESQLDQTKVFYTPNENFYGHDQFVYTVSDGLLESDQATVTINVSPVNDPPIAVDVNAVGDEDTAIDVQMQVIDVDNRNETMTYIVPDQTQNGTLAGPKQDSLLFNYSVNFNGGSVVPGALLYGNAEVSPNGGVDNSGVLKLTRNINGQASSMVINEFVPGSTVKKFTAIFKMHLGEGSGNPADGFSFNFGPDLINGLGGDAENGVGSGLRVCFRIFGDDRIQIKKGDDAPLVDFLTPVYGVADYVVCTINFDEDGTVDVTWNGVAIATDVQTGVVPEPGYRFGIYARTGGENANQWLDDLRINGTLYKQGMIVTTNPQLTYNPNPDWFGEDAFN
ncbi:MAG TPA: immunoglobulin domain-containing protein, partial [Verrucomicrobiota bacterium]|nr:immunoglobulin domain-containing protein [Verrucomicrobiota bacterium]